MTDMDPTPRMRYAGPTHPITGEPVVRQDAAGFAAAVAVIRHEYGLDHPGLLALLPAAYGVPRDGIERLTGLLRSARREPIDIARPIYLLAAEVARELARERTDRSAQIVLQATAVSCLMRAGDAATAEQYARSPWTGDPQDAEALHSVLDGHRKRKQAAAMH